MSHFLSADAVADFDGVILDCRFSLADAAAGLGAYENGHLPGAHYLDLNRDMSAPVREYGGRHPLPAPADFAATLAALGIDRSTSVLVYDDSRFVFAARCWWMLRALGYPTPKILNGGYAAWVAAGGEISVLHPTPAPCALPAVPDRWPLCCDRDELLAKRTDGARLVDAREAARYRGEQEPIDPVAGHIPGAENLPWQSFSDEAGIFVDEARLRELWDDRLEARPLVVYCGSGVSACVNILALAQLGRDDVWLYGGSWSDWCSYL
jgi:thiosulfate/3-mercaptopyruvate sulfurtransferase